MLWRGERWCCGCTVVDIVKVEQHRDGVLMDVGVKGTLVVGERFEICRSALRV